MNDMTLDQRIAKPIQTAKIEFWAATAIFVFAIFSLSTSDEPYRWDFEEVGIHYRFYKHHFWPQLIRYTLLYLGFLLLNFQIIPKLMQKERAALYALLLLVLYVGYSFIAGVLDTYTKSYLINWYYPGEQDYDLIFQDSFRHTLFLLLLVGIYTFIKYSGLYLLSNATAISARYKFVNRETLTAFIIWMVSVFVLMVFDIDQDITVTLGILSLSALALYCGAYYYLIPNALRSKKPLRKYLLVSLLVVILAYLPVTFLLLPFFHDEDNAFGLSFFNSLFQLVVAAPFIWFLFRRQMKGREEMVVLKKELGTTSANLDFLRSQINPHFLFNALNTLYGTALQEKGERTAQGIQMLGDMMRFMLHENHQQKILLSREIEYMRNYIDLQLLRTSASPNIAIETKIDDVVGDKYIAPMLLIPFIENAFKHGISLKHRSWIRISLHSEQDKVYFDVYNSKQKKSEQDPEKDASGIGLANVRQRLNLLYPERHELIIRDTPEEFFVHLTLQL
ncbi:histidine kinase [Pontibacter ramchanderi]|uniref:Histidine kinase n=2 Tax=Pontibacter ramchanderi TaxID=1179743 RepID=A0A2N3V2V3_9BACT|nr:histidine kinase [Pontibacter ramchanderi]